MTALQEQFIRISGCSLRVLTGGEGDAWVLLLASPFATVDVYRPTALAFLERTRVVAVEFPGSGRASGASPPLGLDELADFVPALVDAFGPTPPLLVGHSISAAIAVIAAARHPERIAGLVITDAVGARPGRSLVPVVAGRAVDACIEWRLTLHAWPAVMGNLLRHPRSFLTHISRCAGSWLLPVAARVRVPALIAWGRRDHTMPITAAERLHRAIPHSRLVVSELGSHDWIIDHAGQFVHDVMQVDMPGEGGVAGVQKGTPSATA